MMDNCIEYKSTSGKLYTTRASLIQDCIKGLTSFDPTTFSYKNLPNKITLNNDVNPLYASREWLENLRKKNKPIVLMFSGGIDSSFALESMIQNDCPPDYILVYTFDPFDNNSNMSPYNMEPRMGLDYLNHLKSKIPSLNNTKIWHIHLNSSYMNDFCNNLNWPKQVVGYNFSLESSTLWTTLIKIDNWKDFIFIKGGDVPRYKFDINGNMNFFLVDKQLGERLDFPEKKCYDFILDNPSLFNSMCASIFTESLTNNDISEYDYNKEHGSKYIVKDLQNLWPKIPPQLDKRFSHLVPKFSIADCTDQPLEMILNKETLKSWLFYLQAEKEKPEWYKKYKHAINEHKDWIFSTLQFSGKISEYIPVVST